MSSTYFHRVQQQTPTRFWINNVTREQIALALDSGAVGCTQNPAYTWKLMEHDDEKPRIISLVSEIIKNQTSDNEALIELQKMLITDVAKSFLPVYESSGHKQGYVSIQGDPFQEDTESIIRYARCNVSGSPNLMAKVPVTKEGLEAIRVLLSEGIAINATEVMAISQVADICNIYNEACSSMENPPVCYFSHITGIYDEYLQNVVAEQGIDISPDTLWHAGMVIAKKAYSVAKAISPSIGFIGGGARDLHHFTEMVGANAVVTINWNGTADKLIEQNPVVCQRFFMPTPDAVIDELCEKLPDFVKGYFSYGICTEEYEDFGPVVLFRSMFEEAWNNALNFIKTQRQQ